MRIEFAVSKQADVLLRGHDAHLQGRQNASFHAHFSAPQHRQAACPLTEISSSGQTQEAQEDPTQLALMFPDTPAVLSGP